ncbi:hypothetical protein Desor_3365 [Desulfosporosinus orientis DSM 765]|uniref:Uncharacterized protein n=1 Tax=Desulfosporosinus orientis (strain ATCC 19365 / DSM 765 / NCIMB 8382 / VKM B-1628 / Singapore I) TaxID=768706 RepID=G7WDV6_DESOD|nr:hypothetical protein Desor_3365 [Desulfosporosinus orientis DSM 765]
MGIYRRSMIIFLNKAYIKVLSRKSYWMLEKGGYYGSH